MNNLNKLALSLALFSPLAITANPYVNNIDILNAGISAMDSACLMNAPYGPAVKTDTGEFLNFDRCLESNNYTDFSRAIPLNTKVNGKTLYLSEMSTLTIPHYSLITPPAGPIKMLFVPPLFLVGSTDSIGIRPVEVRTARNYLTEQKALINLISEKQSLLEATGADLPISTLSVFGYKDSKKHESTILLYMAYSDPKSVLIKKIGSEGVEEISEDQFIRETNLLVNPLLKR